MSFPSHEEIKVEICDKCHAPKECCRFLHATENPTVTVVQRGWTTTTIRGLSAYNIPLKKLQASLKKKRERISSVSDEDDTITLEGGDSEIVKRTLMEHYHILEDNIEIVDLRCYFDPPMSLQSLYRRIPVEKFGFIIMEDLGCLYGVVSGNSRRILHRFSADLPRKHTKGGQSSIAFVRKVAETATQVFIENAEANVTGLILAGSADFNVQLSQSDILDNRLKAIILSIFDIRYGGEKGFNQAIKMAVETMKDVMFARERERLNKLFDLIITGGACSFGVRETMMAWESGAIDTLILWDELDVHRCTMRNQEGEESIHYFTARQLEDKEHLTGAAETVVEDVLLTDWMVENHQTRGVKLEFVSDKTNEGVQFQKGLGGIGSLLKFQMCFEAFDDNDDANEGFPSDFDEFENIV